jgi:hypothetical protein
MTDQPGTEALPPRERGYPETLAPAVGMSLLLDPISPQYCIISEGKEGGR